MPRVPRPRRFAPRQLSHCPPAPRRGAPRSGRRCPWDGSGGGDDGGAGVAVLGRVTAAPRPLRSGCPGQAAVAGCLRGCHRCPVPSEVSRPLRGSAGLSPLSLRPVPSRGSRVSPEQRRAVTLSLAFPPLAGCRAGCGAVAGVPSPRGLSRVPPAQLGAVTGVSIPSPPGLSRLRRGGRNAEFLCCVTRFVRGLERLCADSGGFVIF